MTPQRRGLLSLYLCAAVIQLFMATSLMAQEQPRSSGWIAIPATEYQLLRARAYPAEPVPEVPPVQATLTRISYDLKINGELAVGQANLTIDVIKDGWVSVPIPSALLIREARLDGKPVSLVADSKASGKKSAVFSYKGRAELLLDIVLPVASTAANESISLPPAIAGITRASVQLPRQGVDMKLVGGFLAEKSASPTESKWVAYGRGNEPLIFSWWRKSEDHRSTQPLRLRGSLTEIVGLAEDTTSIQAEVDVEILQGAAHEMRIRLPEKVTVNQVSGAMVADWEVKPGELVVTFLEPIEKGGKFVIVGETRTSREGQIAIPLIRLLNVERETGGVAIEVLGAGEIKNHESSGLESADATDLGEIVSSRQSPTLLAFRFRSGAANTARSLIANVARYTQEAVLMANVEEARYQILSSEEGKTLIKASYAIRNNQRSFLKITLPADTILWSATLSGSPIRPGKAPDGSLLLPLEKSRSGEDAPAFPAEIFYLHLGDQWKDSGKLKLPLPSLDLPISRTGLQYFYPPLYKATPEPGSFRVQKYQDPASPAFTSKAPQVEAELGRSSISPAPVIGKEKADTEAQTLVEKYRAKTFEGKRAGILPIKLTFPIFGRSIFLVSELTAENQAPIVDISYEAEK